MAKIKNANPRQSGGGYVRLVGNKLMADIFTKAQSTVISNGTELEKIISTEANLINDLDKFIDDCDKGIISSGAYLCTKRIAKKSKYSLEKHEPDFIAFTLDKSQRNCYIVELKDGDAFDTKKSAAEKEMLQAYVNHLAPLIPFRIKYYICSFNQLDKSKIITGFKNVFTINEIMTGKEFCDTLGINYEQIIELRKKDTDDNFKFVVDKMAEIAEIKAAVVEAQRKHIAQDEFYDEVPENDEYDLND